MSADHFRAMRLQLTHDEFRRLPRNAAYKYELIGGEAWISPRPRWHHALLDLHSFPPPPEIDPYQGIELRPLRPADWDELRALFAAAFRQVQPFGSLDDEDRRDAARQCLEQTRTGGDGPLIEPACFVAVQGEAGRVCGAIMPTLIPQVDLSDIDASPRWQGPPPAGSIEKRLGLAHLTWIFVCPLRAGHGVGSILLAAAVKALLSMGFEELATTFLAGNDSSMLWHWRNGFRLLGHPGSWRELNKRWK